MVLNKTTSLIKVGCFVIQEKEKRSACSMIMRPSIAEALDREKDTCTVQHPSRDELLLFLADVKSKHEKITATRTHVHGCKQCQERCYMMDSELDY